MYALCCLVLFRPLQTYLDASFKAEKMTNEFLQLATEMPRDGTATEEQQQALDSARREAKNPNAKFVSGQRGRDVVRKFGDLLRDQTGGLWSDCPAIQDEEKFQISCGILQGLADAQNRLVWYYEQPQYQIMADPSTARTILRKHGRCTECVDEHFSVPWAQRLTSQDDAIAKPACDCISDVLSSIPVNSLGSLPSTHS